MGKTIERNRSKTLPSSPTHSFSSSSSSDFEFRISISPRKSSAALCPADKLFYKGQLLPLHLSPRISMVRTLILASSSTSSSSDTTTTASRDSSSSNDSTSSSFATDLSLLAAGDPCCDSSRPSSVAEEDNHINHNHNHNNRSNENILKRLTNKKYSSPSLSSSTSKYFFLSRFSSVFKKDNVQTKENTKSSSGSNNNSTTSTNDTNPKKMSSTAKDVIRKYMKKVKPLYEKLSSKQQPGGRSTISCVGPTRTSSSTTVLLKGIEKSAPIIVEGAGSGAGGATSFSQTFSGNLNLKCTKIMKRSYVASCPSSMRSSPSHSGVLTRGGLPLRAGGASTSQGSCSYSSETSTMEELHNAIQGAIAHCKNSMVQSSSSSFNNNINIDTRINKKCKAFEI